MFAPQQGIFGARREILWLKLDTPTYLYKMPYPRSIPAMPQNQGIWICLFGSRGIYYSMSWIFDLCLCLLPLRTCGYAIIEPSRCSSLRLHVVGITKQRIRFPATRHSVVLLPIPMAVGANRMKVEIAKRVGQNELCNDQAMDHATEHPGD